MLVVSRFNIRALFLEMRALDTIESIIRLKDPDEKNKTLRLIYRIAHSANDNHSCYDVHQDWRKEAAIVFDQLKDV